MATNGHMGPWQKSKAAVKWVDSKLHDRPRLVNLEVTKKCNAGCGFCPYWMTKTETVLDDYAPIIRKFTPMVVTISGGEPTLRKNIVDIVGGIKESQRFVYVSMVTNASLMTPELAQKLFGAGLSQITFSVDFPDERHDAGRKLPGNLARIKKLCRDLQPIGFDRISFNTFIMKDNMSEAVNIAKLAYELGVSVSYSAYSSLKTDKDDQMVLPSDVPQLHRTIEEIIALKRRTGHVRNSDYYLRKIPEYFAKGGIGGCQAGRAWIHVTADGHVQPCSELPVIAHFSEYTVADLEKSKLCDKCWFACRGESTVPVSAARVGEMIGKPSFGAQLA